MKKDKKVERAPEEDMKESKVKVERAPEEDMKEDEGPSDQEVEMAMNDLLRAHKHKNNKKLMAAIAKMSLDKSEAIESMADLKMAKKNAFTKDESDA